MHGYCSDVLANDGGQEYIRRDLCIPLADHEAAIAAAYERGREEALCLVGIVSLSVQNADRLDAMHEGRLMAVSEARAIIARAAEVEKEAGE